MNHDHNAHLSKIKITEFNIKPSSKSTANSRHYCPMHGHMMNGPYCNMGLSLLNDLDSSTKTKKCFLSVDCGGAPFNNASAINQSDNEFTISTGLDNKLREPSFTFIYSADIDYPMGYFRSPEKPPKQIS